MSSPLSFKQFLSIVNEDASADVAKLQSDIATIDAAINQKTGPLLMQRQRLQKMLAIKQKQQETENARAQAQQKQQADKQSPMQAQAQQGQQGQLPNV
jgi:hypothetical protein